MLCRCLLNTAVALSLAALGAYAEAVPAFDASGLVKLGDATSSSLASPASRATLNPWYRSHG